MPLAREDFQFVTSLVKDHAGIVLDEGKAYLIETRLLALAREEKLSSVGGVVAKAREPGNARWIHRIVEAIERLR